MKHIISILAIAAATLIPHHAAAQFRYGLRLGGDINTSALTKAPSMGIKHLSGFSGGVTFEYQLENRPWAFDASVMYTYTGIKLKEKAADRQSWKLGNDFIEVPLHVKYKFWLHSTKDLVGPYIFTGPAMMVRVDRDDDASPIRTRPFQIGWDVGAGIDIINFVQIQAGYRFGLNNVVENGSTLSTARLRNDGVNISVALLFDF